MTQVEVLHSLEEYSTTHTNTGKSPKLLSHPKASVLVNLSTAVRKPTLPSVTFYQSETCQKVLLSALSKKRPVTVVKSLKLQAVTAPLLLTTKILAGQGLSFHLVLKSSTHQPTGLLSVLSLVVEESINLCSKLAELTTNSE